MNTSYTPIIINGIFIVVGVIITCIVNLIIRIVEHRFLYRKLIAEISCKLAIGHYRNTKNTNILEAIGKPDVIQLMIKTFKTIDNQTRRKCIIEKMALRKNLWVNKVFLGQIIS